MDIDSFMLKFTEKKIAYIKADSKYFIAEKELMELSKKLNTKQKLMGLFLGEDVKGLFKPSLALLEILSENSEEKVFVNGIGEIDFLYGKGIKARHIKAVKGGTKEGFLKLVQNQHDENLGYGKVAKGLTDGNAELANLLDRGDFIRREKN